MGSGSWPGMLAVDEGLGEVSSAIGSTTDIGVSVFWPSVPLSLCLALLSPNILSSVTSKSFHQSFTLKEDSSVPLRSAAGAKHFVCPSELTEFSALFPPSSATANGKSLVGSKVKVD